MRIAAVAALALPPLGVAVVAVCFGSMPGWSGAPSLGTQRLGYVILFGAVAAVASMWGLGALRVGRSALGTRVLGYGSLLCALSCLGAGLLDVGSVAAGGTALASWLVVGAALLAGVDALVLGLAIGGRANRALTFVSAVALGFVAFASALDAVTAPPGHGWAAVVGIIAALPLALAGLRVTTPEGA